MACPERELLESEVKQAVKRWTDLDKATAAIRDADRHDNEYLATAHRARTTANKARAALDEHVSVHRCGLGAAG